MSLPVEILLAVAMSVGIIDVILFNLFGAKGTISYQMYIAAKASPIIPLALGVLMGHLFWPNAGACP